MPQTASKVSRGDRRSYSLYEDFTNVLSESQQVITDCFDKFKAEEVFLSFNGGKDCTVLLDITLDLLSRSTVQPIENDTIRVVYIRTNEPFDEVEKFVESVRRHYNVQVKVVEGDLREALYKLTLDESQLKACLMGTRRTDPYSSHLQFMQETDAGWPKIMRVLPLLNWSYHQIWSYILERGVPYCKLYEIGYTSIGSMSNTQPNPALMNEGQYSPGWLLKDPNMERFGRTARPVLTITNGHQHGEHTK